MSFTKFTAELTPNQVKSLLLKMYFRDDVPKPLPSILLLGMPGCGKSELVRQLGQEIAEKIGKTYVEYSDDIADEVLRSPKNYFVLVDRRVIEHEPSDFSGIPRVREDYVEFKPLKWAKVLARTSGILFLDELTNIQRDDLKSVCYKLILDRAAGDVKFRNDVLIIAAGNLPEQSSIATALPAPLVNRLMIINVKPPTIWEWYEYMEKYYGHNWCRKIFAYIKTYESDFIRLPQETETLENYPTPRSWTRLALMLGSNYTDKYSSEELKMLCTGFLGSEVGLKVAKFLEKHVPSIDELLQEPEKFTRLDLDVKYTFVILYGVYLNENFDKIFITDRSGKYLMKSEHEKLINVIINDSEELLLVMIESSSSKRSERLRLAMMLCKVLPKVHSIFEKLKKLKEELEYLEK